MVKYKMTTFINALIKEKRPKITDSSVRTYVSYLKNLYERVFGELPTSAEDLKRFDDEEDKIMEFLKNVPFDKRKSIASALVVITQNDNYRTLMLNDIDKYEKSLSQQQKSKKQAKNWVEMEEVKKIYNHLKKTAQLLYKKDNLNMNDLQQIQAYIILSVLGGIHIPVRRSKDFTEFKIKDIDKTKYNFLEKNEFVFNTYKTAWKYGSQKVVIPSTLKRIINKWVKHNPTEWLFFDTNYKKLNSVSLNQRLKKIFEGKNISTNMLRHIYLSDKYQDTIELQEDIQQTMGDMGSSSNMLDVYVKRHTK